ncbi:MAG: cysteine--tRNA ligase [Alphaproteobacteria bacterium]
MALVLYNTLTREKEPLEPLRPGRVGMYVCGPTVYDFAHVGNARPVVVFDVLFRLLRKAYGEDHVAYVRNITDIDDKIIAAAKETGEPIDALTARTTRAFHEDMAALGALEPTFEPRATEHIPEMIAMIEKLLESGHAYEADGHVLFNVPSMPEYGRLSGRSRKDMIAGARVEVAPYKKDPADFVLWKPSEQDQPGWESPWGRGRPGWHIECSAMSATHLGETFDIHGGGQDLVFPHHENEIAQSTGAHGGEPFARYWVHNGYVTVEGEKMSKSLGNIVTVRDLLEKGHRGEAIRLALLGAQYRQPLDFSLDGLGQSRHALDRFYTALRHAADVKPEGDDAVSDEVSEALDDDLNTPLAISHLHELATALNKAEEREEKARLKGALLAGGGLLGLLSQDAEEWFKGRPEEAPEVTEPEIESLIKRRAQARAQKDFARADHLRAELAAKGVVLEDRPDGTTEWRRAG